MPRTMSKASGGRLNRLPGYKVDAEMEMGATFTGMNYEPRERWIYRPETANRVIPESGGYVFVIKWLPTRNPPAPGCGYWATHWQESDRAGYDRYGRYSVQVALPDGSIARLFPPEYAILSDADISRGVEDGELVFHPMGGSVNLQDMPELMDLMGALMLDGLTLYEAQRELYSAGVEGAGEIRVPPPGWYEARFELPWLAKRAKP